MPFFLLILLALIYMQGQWPEPPLGVAFSSSLLLTAAGLGTFVLLAAGISAWSRRALAVDAEHAAHHVRRFAFWRRNLFFGMLAFYAVALYGLGWGYCTKQLQSDRFIPGVELLTLAPLLGGFFFSWVFFYDMDRAAHRCGGRDDGAFPGRLTYVLLHIRNNLVLVVPPLILMTLQQSVLRLFPNLIDKSELNWVNLTFVIVFLGVGMVLIPLVYRAFLGLRPLPDGPIRTRLAAAADRLRFRYADILLWDTRGAMANAMVTGVFPWMRYVVVTDRLLESLDPEEIDAVFGHEVGHIKHRHMTFYIWFLLTSMIVLGHLWNLAAEAALAAWPNVAWLPSVAEPLFLAVMVGYVFVAFGFLSRRCERQADLYGCRAASPAAFASALDKVADLNGISRDRPGLLASWQHSTIGRRIAFVRAVEADPDVETRFQRRLAWLRWLTTGVLTAGAAIAIWVSGSEALRHL